MNLDIGGGRPIAPESGKDFTYTPSGWVSINRYAVYNPDIVGCVCDIPLMDSVVERVRLLHFPYQWLDSGSIRELYRVLKPRGLLTLRTGRAIERNETFEYHLNKLFDMRNVDGTFVGHSRKEA